MTSLDRGIEEAALVTVPDALTARILLARRSRPWCRYAAAALFASISAALGLLASGIDEAPPLPRALQAVGPTHPAVTAIAEVANEEAQAAAQSPAEDKAEMEQSLKRLGLSLKQGEARAYYVGKCHIGGTSECEHIVLSTPDGHANVMLVPNYPVYDRLFVIDQRMVALVSPVGDGGYIVVADSVKTARRMEKLIVKG